MLLVMYSVRDAGHEVTNGPFIVHRNIFTFLVSFIHGITSNKNMYMSNESERAVILSIL